MPYMRGNNLKSLEMTMAACNRLDFFSFFEDSERSTKVSIPKMRLKLFGKEESPGADVFRFIRNLWNYLVAFEHVESLYLSYHVDETLPSGYYDRMFPDSKPGPGPLWADWAKPLPEHPSTSSIEVLDFDLPNEFFVPLGGVCDPTEDFLAFKSLRRLVVPQDMIVDYDPGDSIDDGCDADASESDDSDADTFVATLFPPTLEELEIRDPRRVIELWVDTLDKQQLPRLRKLGLLPRHAISVIWFRERFDMAFWGRFARRLECEVAVEVSAYDGIGPQRISISASGSPMSDHS
jgi:hypothetical protein